MKTVFIAIITSLTLHLPATQSLAHFEALQSRVGTLSPVTLVLSHQEPPMRVQAQLSVTPNVPVRVLSRGHDIYNIIPIGGWPAKAHIRLSYPGILTPLDLTTDDDREIIIQLSQQRLQARRGGRVIKSFAINSGAPPAWTTPTGTFWIYKKVLDDHMVGGDPKGEHWDVNHVPYAQYFNDAIAIHGAWWAHRFGHPVSHGCIQLSTSQGPHGPTKKPDNAQWVWDFTDIGTPVIVTGQTPDPRRQTKSPLPYPGPGESTSNSQSPPRPR